MAGFLEERVDDVFCFVLVPFQYELLSAFTYISDRKDSEKGKTSDRSTCQSSNRLESEKIVHYHSVKICFYTLLFPFTYLALIQLAVNLARLVGSALPSQQCQLKFNYALKCALENVCNQVQ